MYVFVNVNLIIIIFYYYDNKRFNEVIENKFTTRYLNCCLEL